MTDLRSNPWPPGVWRSLLAESVTSVDELLSEVDLEAHDFGSRADVLAAAGQFPVRVPRSFVARMRKGDPDDPLLRQVLPTGIELAEVEGFSGDPLLEAEAAVQPGVLRKYRGRILVISTGSCAVHCRYCFRRHFEYQNEVWSDRRIAEFVSFLQEQPDVEEVILSGGDPLVQPDSSLERFAGRIADTGSVQRLRVHTRLPVVLPQRVDSDLIRWIARSRLRVVFVLHVNHANEIDDDVSRAVVALRAANAMVLNQSVLLAGVNDSVSELSNLSRALVGIGVVPYYLHLLDRVQGAAAFDVDDAKAQRILSELRKDLPGYMVPKMVREHVGAPFKVPAGTDEGLSDW